MIDFIEITSQNISIDPELNIDFDGDPPSVVAYIEMWFDVDKKFGTDTHDKDDTWINLYAMYDPIGRELSLEFYIESDTSTSEPIRYMPTEAEKAAIIEMVEAKCMEINGCTCREFLSD